MPRGMPTAPPTTDPALPIDQPHPVNLAPVNHAPPAARPQMNDDFSYIMAEALADRLAEAFAEKLHEVTRREWWGYAPDEAFNVDDLLKVKYQVRARLCLAAPVCVHGSSECCAGSGMR